MHSRAYPGLRPGKTISVLFCGILTSLVLLCQTVGAETITLTGGEKFLGSPYGKYTALAPKLAQVLKAMKEEGLFEKYRAASNP